MESTIDTTSGRVTVHYEKDGKPQDLERTLKLPPDLSNGLVFMLVKNVLANPVTTVSYLALTPKPMVVKLVFVRREKEKLKAGTMPRTGVRFVVKVDIGGIKGALAALLKKKPPDTEMWVLDEKVPTFVASEGPLYGEGPVWTIELESPKVARASQSRDRSR